MKIEDLVGLSKPLTRFIEVVSQRIGQVFAPYLIKKKAEAKEYEMQIIANAIQKQKYLYHSWSKEHMLENCVLFSCQP